MYGSDSEVFGSLVDLDDFHQLSPAATIPSPAADQPPHHQVAPVHIQDVSESTKMLPASALPTDEPAHQNARPLLPTTDPTGSEPDHQPPPQQGAPGQDESKALILVPNSTTPPPTEPRNNEVIIDIRSDSESDDSDEVRVLGSFTPVDLPLAAIPPPPTTTTPSTSRFGEFDRWWPAPVSWIPSDLRLLCHGGETTDDKRTETDDDVLPSPPPPQPSPQLQQFLEQQLELTMSQVEYWRKVVTRGTQGEPERPDWLPEDWDMKCVTRTSGSSAGNRDKYYIEPGIRRRQFRSKREVLQFLEMGKRRQYKRKANSTAMPSNVNRPFEGTSSSSWQNIRIASHLEASTSRQNEETPNLDSDTVPEKQNEETPPPPNVDSDKNPPKKPCGSPSK